MIDLSDIFATLKVYRFRYKWLHVLAGDVEELQSSEGAAWSYAGQNCWGIRIGGEWLQMQLRPLQGVARFSVSPTAIEPTGIGGDLMATLEATVAAAASRRPRDEDAVLGLLVGLLTRHAEGGLTNCPQPPDENRVMTVAFGPGSGEPRFYRGPYFRWAKSALR